MAGPRSRSRPERAVASGSGSRVAGGRPGGTPAGDLYAAVQIVTPKNLDARARELFEELSRLIPNA